MSIRASVEDHEKAMQTWSGRLFMLPAALLVLVLAPLVIINALAEKNETRKWNKANGYCLKCGHKHTGVLLIGQDAHNWTTPRTCAGTR